MQAPNNLNVSSPGSRPSRPDPLRPQAGRQNPQQPDSQRLNPQQPSAQRPNPRGPSPACSPFPRPNPRDPSPAYSSPQRSYLRDPSPAYTARQRLIPPHLSPQHFQPQRPSPVHRPSENQVTRRTSTRTASPQSSHSSPDRGRRRSPSRRSRPPRSDSPTSLYEEPFDPVQRYGLPPPSVMRSTSSASSATNKPLPRPPTEGSQGLPTYRESQLIHSQHSEPSSPVEATPERVSEPEKVLTDEEHLARLPPDQAEILKAQIELKKRVIKIKSLWRFATRNDMFIVWISIVCAIIGGAATPMMTLVFGQSSNVFRDFLVGEKTQQEARSQLVHFVYYYIYLAVGEFITIYVSTVGFMYTGEHISGRIRKEYLAACLRQNIGFYDKLSSGEITTRITSDTNLIQDGVSQKVGLLLTALSTFVSAFVIGFIKAWKLTFILVSSMVAIMIVFTTGTKYKLKFEFLALRAYGKAGNVAEEVLSSARVVTAFSAQDSQAKRYEKMLFTAEGFGFKQRSAMGLLLAGFFFVIYLNYGLAFWQGSHFLINGELSIGAIMTTVMAIMTGAFAFGNVSPNIAAIFTGVSAAKNIYSVIDRKSPINVMARDGIKPMRSKQPVAIDLVNLTHIYPSRPGVTVMNDVNLHIPAGKTTALVGASGSGKSSIIYLLERFYQPVSGQIFFDGVDISTLDLKWLRQQIALVGQEPTLFATTVLENIQHGLIGTEHEFARPEEKYQLAIEAAKKANAHDFISMLPEGYDTNVGERGFLMSGGQKQRIAIARAIVSDPRVLLLDEATSALDTKSEAVVQAALDAAAEGRTTIVVAHRLSTIKDAHNIVVMKQGQILEQGPHSYLIKSRGPYYDLVEAQSIEQITNGATEEPSSPDDDHRSPVSKEALFAEDVQTEDFFSKSFGSMQTLVDKKQWWEDPFKKFKEKLQREEAEVLVRAVMQKQLEAAPQERDYTLWELVKVIGSFNKPEWPWMLLGLFCSIIAGAGNPVQALFYAKQVMGLIGYPRIEDVEQARHNADFWCWMYFMLAFVQLLAYCGQGITFAYCSERLVRRARDTAFRTLLNQDISFFDKDENSTGALTSFLATEATRVSGLSGATLGTILSVVSTLVVVLAMTEAIGWKLATVTATTIPVLLACGYLRFWILAQQQKKAKAAYQQSATYACEATGAIRTVASLTREDDVLRRYAADIAAQEAKDLRDTLKTSAIYALSQSLTFLASALGFWYGTTVVINGEYSLMQYFIIYPAIQFGTTSAGTLFSFAPDMGRAKDAARTLKVLFDRQPPIDSTVTDRLSLEPKKVSGHIEFDNVHFRYPTRPEVPVLRGLDLTIDPGQFVALVGASGCGKSTTISLLERFYDPVVGSVRLDGEDIRDLNPGDYRSAIALVPQEPTLFSGSVRENLLLGATREVSEREIERACRDANIYDFIVGLPDGFNTVVGNKGGMLSGGQKQRVAIARALLRQPKVLLLDEATSALDSQSEGVVQAALDKAARGRTTIAIAHRLASVRNADMICVFEAGRVVEKGNHRELMELNGRYKDMVCAQDLEGKKRV